MNRTGFLRRTTVAGIFLATATLTGCLRDPQIEEFVEGVAWEIHPARLEPVHEYRAGEGLLGLASFALSFADMSDLDERQVRALIQDLSAVHIGVYEIRGRRGPIHVSRDWRLDLEEQGWTPLVRLRAKQDENQWILARVEGGQLRALTVVSIENDELVVLKLEGRLQRSLDFAMRRDQEFLRTARQVGPDM